MRLSSISLPDAIVDLPKLMYAKEILLSLKLRRELARGHASESSGKACTVSSRLAEGDAGGTVGWYVFRCFL